MTTTLKRACVIALASSALWGAHPARADIFSINWGYRWSGGEIRHDTSVADSDPSAARDVYTNSILDFDMQGLRISDFTFPRLQGAGGTIVVDNAVPGSGAADTITFLFGAPVPGDSAAYRLVATFDPEFPTPSHVIDQPWVAGLSGMVYRGDQEFILGMSPGYPTWHERVAAPVPEPGTWALFGLGLAGITAARWRRRAA